MLDMILKSFLTKDMIARLTRTALQAGASSLITYGFISAGDAEVVIGAVVLVVTTLYTAFSSYKTAAKIEAAKVGGLA